MKEWLHNLLFEYDSFGGMIFNYFFILFVYLFCWFWISMILNVIISSLIDFKKKREEIKYGYNVKRDIKYDNLYKKIEGIIINSKQESEIVTDDRNKFGEVFKYTYKYKYQTKDENIYDGIEEVNGEQPEEFYNLEEEPIEVKVTYLESNPKYSRVFEYTTNNKNLYEWFRYTILYYFIFVTIWSYFIYSKKRNNND